MELNPRLSGTDCSHSRKPAVRLATKADLSENSGSTRRDLRH